MRKVFKYIIKLFCEITAGKIINQVIFMNSMTKWALALTAALAALSAIIYFTFINTGEENVPQVAEASPDDIKVAAVGDSTTYGLMVDNREKNAYPHKLSEQLGEGYWVGNFGTNNYAAMKSADFPYPETKEYSDSLELKADIAVIMLGTNDSKETNWQGKEQFRKEYSELVDAYAESNPDMRIYLATPPKAFNDADMTGDINNQNVEKITDVVKETAAKKGTGLIDINQLTQEERGWFQIDGIHPNAEGADGIAEEVEKHIAN